MTDICVGDIVRCVDFSGSGSGPKLREHSPDGLYIVDEIEGSPPTIFQVRSPHDGWRHGAYANRFVYVSSPVTNMDPDYTLDEIHAAQALVNGA